MASYLVSGLVSRERGGTPQLPFLVRVEANRKRQAVSKFWAGDLTELIGNGGFIVEGSMKVELEK